MDNLRRGINFTSKDVRDEEKDTVANHFNIDIDIFSLLPTKTCSRN